MTCAERIVDALLEGEMDAFVQAAFAPMLQSWAKPDEHEEGRFLWSTPTFINKDKALFRLVIDPDMPVEDSNPPRKCISMMCALIDLSGRLTTYGNWFGFTYADEVGEQHILMGIHSATRKMRLTLKKPVIWPRGKALATSASDRFSYMQRTIWENVMTPEAKKSGVTYFTGAPKVEDETLGAHLYRNE